MNLENAKLKRLNLLGINLSKSNLSGADFSDSNLENANLEKPNINDTDFCHARIKGMFFKNVIGKIQFNHAIISPNLPVLSYNGHLGYLSNLCTAFIDIESRKILKQILELELQKCDLYFENLPTEIISDLITIIYYLEDDFNNFQLSSSTSLMTTIYELFDFYTENKKFLETAFEVFIAKNL